MKTKLEVENLEERALMSAAPLTPLVPSSNLYQAWDGQNLRQFYVDPNTNLWHYETQAAGDVWVDRAVTADQEATLDAAYAHGGLLNVFEDLKAIANLPPTAPEQAPQVITVVQNDQTQVVKDVPVTTFVSVEPAPLPPPLPPYVPPTQAELDAAFTREVNYIAQMIEGTVTADTTFADVSKQYPIIAQVEPDALLAALLIAQKQGNQ